MKKLYCVTDPKSPFYGYEGLLVNCAGMTMLKSINGEVWTRVLIAQSQLEYVCMV